MNSLKTEIVDLLKIRKEERWPTVAFLLLILFFQYLMISKFFFLFADYGDSNWTVFMRNFHMSGFDPITYSVLTDWNLGYDILRHPLLAFLLYPVYGLNQLLWWVTGCNCCQLLAALFLVFFSVYSFVLLYRILTQVIGLGTKEAGLLTFFFFSFAYVLVSLIVPDHFCCSLFLILLTLYRGGMKLKLQQYFSLKETLCLFLIVSGVTLSNGVIVFLTVLFTNRASVFQPVYFLGAFVLPAVFLLSVALGVHMAVDVAQTHLLAPVAGQMEDVHQEVSKDSILVENFLGESIQLHRKHVLSDVLTNRPVIVTYTWPIQYVVEALISLCFVLGVGYGRNSRFLWLSMSLFGFAVLLHFILGFGLNEVFIMADHWIYVIPIAMAYLLLAMSPHRKIFICVLLFCITLYLWIYHGCLLYRYLTWPVKQ